MKTTKTTTKAEAIKTLKALGVELLKAEDRFGETKTGWFVDGVWLAPKNEPEAALRFMNGN